VIQALEKRHRKNIYDVTFVRIWGVGGDDSAGRDIGRYSQYDLRR
jgi:hypothetical protein